MENNILSIKITPEIEDTKTPSLYEIWNWEGDQSILPYKVKKFITYSGWI
jgi:hypothetical protein